ncbi:MAG: CvpA family protein [Bacteroidaceae bacterium]|nr:CvpA family protein [Bacteroidaceae bacterium]
MTFIDIFILAILAIGFVTGLIKGVVKQAFGLGGLIAGLALGALFCHPVATLLINSINISEKSAAIVSFILILILVPLVFNLIGLMLSKFVKIVQLGFLDRVLGGLFGVLSYMIVLGLLLQLIEITGLSGYITDKEEGERKSVLYEPVRTTTDFCLHWAWDRVSGFIDEDVKEEKEGEMV